MPDVICDTSSLQYLHQLNILDILPELAGEITVPPAVVDEINAGRAIGIDLPDLTKSDWITIRRPISSPALPLINDLGPGETEVLMLALEIEDALVVFDDRLARQVAELLNLKLTGTLGLLLDAKQAGLISAIGPYLDQLDRLRFRLAQHTRIAVLNLAGEESLDS